jgi:hypothetical protein
VLTSTVDFTGWEELGFPKNNIAVRVLLIKLPHDLYVCFDQDLLAAAHGHGADAGTAPEDLTTFFGRHSERFA